MQKGHGIGRESIAAICPKCLKLLNVDSRQLIVRVHKDDAGQRCAGSSLSIVGWRLDRAPSGKLVFVQAGWNHSSSREQGMRLEHTKLKVEHMQAVHYPASHFDGEGYQRGVCSAPVDPLGFSEDIEEVTCNGCQRVLSEQRTAKAVAAHTEPAAPGGPCGRTGDHVPHLNEADYSVCPGVQPSDTAEGSVHGYDGFEHGRTLCGEHTEDVDVRDADEEITCPHCLVEAGVARAYVHAYDRLGGQDEDRTLCDAVVGPSTALTGDSSKVTCPICRKEAL